MFILVVESTTPPWMATAPPVRPVPAPRGMTGTWCSLHSFITAATSSVLVASTNSIASAILTESSLSYLGFGISIPNPSWGGMLEGAQTYILTHPTLAVYPGVCILLTVLCFNVLGNGFRRRFSPNSGR